MPAIYLKGQPCFTESIDSSQLPSGRTIVEVTKKFAEYVVNTNLEDFPPEAIGAAKAAIIDCLGCALAGSKEPLADVLVNYLADLGGKPAATVIGRGFKTSAQEAGLINGAMSHALDYDDITFITKTHPSAVLIPAALPVAEEIGASGRDMLLAYLVGFEVACAVGDAISTAYFDDLGWHPTGPLGALGAAAAAARLLGLDVEQTAMAISLGASQSSGLRQNFGTMTKPFHAGHACKSGITAAKLVQGGFTAGTDALEGRFGFMRAFSGGNDYDPEKAAASLGSRCFMIESGIEIKKYPCCGSAHLALDAVSAMQQREALEAANIERIEVRVDFDPPRSLIHSRPKEGLEGKFSMQYCLAAEILDGRVGMSTFTDEQVMRPEAQELIPKIEMIRHAGFEGQTSWTEANHEVEIHLKDGRVLTQRADRATTGSLRGATLEEVHTKFLDTAAMALTQENTAATLEMLDNLEDIGPVGPLADLLGA
ncbi:MAG TPA: MmgE/PrpD family protein [Dehalococcoidia bacterium]|nr:MmgE/PrpD family protein [Dehalococcoidia bacterium]HIN23251.1 MmgE/PrpD family protein [Dehalococcoidia bacterium]